MGGQRTSFSKLQRDRDKKAKAAAKRERRQERSANPDIEDASTDTLVQEGTGELSAEELLKRIESIHRRYEAKTITYEEYEEEKADLLSRLPVD